MLRRRFLSLVLNLPMGLLVGKFLPNAPSDSLFGVMKIGDFVANKMGMASVRQPWGKPAPAVLDSVISDFESGNVRDVDGWILADTEVQFCIEKCERTPL